MFDRDAAFLDSGPAFIGPKYSFQLDNLVAANVAECYDEIVKTVLSSNLSRTLKNLHWSYSAHDLVMPRFMLVRVKQALREPRTLGSDQVRACLNRIIFSSSILYCERL